MVSRRSGLKLRGELVQISHVRGHCAVPAADLRVRWLDHEVLVRRVRSAAVSETVVTSRKADRRVGEDVTGIGARQTRKQDRVDAAALQNGEHRCDDRRIGRRTRWVVAAAWIHLDVAEAAFREMRLEGGDRAVVGHVGYEPKIE